MLHVGSALGSAVTNFVSCFGSPTVHMLAESLIRVVRVSGALCSATTATIRDCLVLSLVTPYLLSEAAGHQFCARCAFSWHSPC